MKRTISKEHFYSHEINQVWAAISQGDLISKWFIKADFNAVVGYQYTFTHENTKIKGEVLKADPVYELVYTWVVSGTEAITTVAWKLKEQDGGTLLILEHSGIENYPESSAVQMFTSFDQGWNHCLEELSAYLSDAKAKV